MCLQDAIFHLYKVKKTIVGISKTKYPKHHIKDCYEVKRGANKESLWVTCSEPYYAEHYSVITNIIVRLSLTPRMTQRATFL